MALLKKKMTKYGVEAEYWKIGMVTIDRLNKIGCCSIYLYLNEDASKENINGFIECEPITSLMNTEGDRTPYDEHFESDEYVDVYTAWYEYIKENEEFFKDAVDC